MSAKRHRFVVKDTTPKPTTRRPQQRSLRLTTRGKAIAVLSIITIAWLSYDLLLKDVCWVGNGYGSCQELWNTYPNEGATP